MHIATLLFAFAGFTGLCAAMNKHQLELLGRRIDVIQQRRLRFLASGMLAASYATAIAAGGWKFGSVEWVGAIMMGATALTLLLPYRPRWVGAAALGAAGLAVLLAAITPFGLS